MVRWLEDLRQDAAYAARLLRQAPAFTAVAVLTLALAIGANTAIFTVINAVMLRPLPVPRPGELVMLTWQAHAWPHSDGMSSYGDCPNRDQASETAGAGCTFSYPLFRQVQASGVFARVFACGGGGRIAVSVAGRAAWADARYVSGDFFSVLGVMPQLGRFFGPRDDVAGATPAIVISDGYWRRRFGGDPGVIGRSVKVNDTAAVVVGVAPRGFTGMRPGIAEDLWIPLATKAQVAANIFGPAGLNATGDTRQWWVEIVGRLKSPAAAGAAAAANAVFQRAVAAGPAPQFKPSDAPRLALAPAGRGLAALRNQFARMLLLLLAAVGVVLLIACANLAGLLLARAAARRRELAVRGALGAARGRLIRQLLTESLLLALAGGALGVVVAVWGARALAAFFAANSYAVLHLDLAPDWRVLAFAVAATVATGLLFGFAPAWRGGGGKLAPALKESAGSIVGRSGRGPFTLGNVLVAAQVALAIVVLAGAGLLVRTLVSLDRVHAGFDTHNLLTFRLAPELTGYSGPRLAALYPQLQARLRALPGVRNVSYSSDTLLSGNLWITSIYVGDSSREHDADALRVGPGYFATLKVPLLAGRVFTATEFAATAAAAPRAEPRVAVVNEAFARRYLPRGAALGARVGSDKGAAQTEIVGVVANTKYSDLRRAVQPTIFYPFQPGQGVFTIRTAMDPRALIPSVRAAVAGLDADLPLFEIKTQTEIIARSLAQERLLADLSSLFGLLALALAAIGVYGLLAYEVQGRTREIGIRLALGAERGAVLRLVARRGLLLALAGAALGIGASLLATRALAGLLFGVTANDPVTYAGVAILLIAVALAASIIPARRAARVDAMTALRQE